MKILKWIYFPKSSFLEAKGQEHLGHGQVCLKVGSFFEKVFIGGCVVAQIIFFFWQDPLVPDLPNFFYKPQLLTEDGLNLKVSGFISNGH